MIDMLCARGADVDAVDVYGCTPLHHSFGGGDAVTCVLWLEHGAKVDARNHRNETPLFDAVCFEHTTVVRVLLAAGACSNATNVYGHTPVGVSCFYGCQTVVEMLLDAGADRYLMDASSIVSKPGEHSRWFASMIAYGQD